MSKRTKGESPVVEGTSHFNCQIRQAIQPVTKDIFDNTATFATPKHPLAPRKCPFEGARPLGRAAYGPLAEATP